MEINEIRGKYLVNIPSIFINSYHFSIQFHIPLPAISVVDMKPGARDTRNKQGTHIALTLSPVGGPISTLMVATQ